MADPIREVLLKILRSKNKSSDKEDSDEEEEEEEEENTLDHIL